MKRVHPEPRNRTERRREYSRRQRHPWLSDWIWGLRGRRRSLRRIGDRRTAAAVVDLYDTRVLVVTLSVLVLSAADAAFTLALIEQGRAREANPLMGLLLSLDVDVFVNVKVAVTGAGLIALVAWSGLDMFGRVRLESALYVLALGYLGLVGYELTLLGAI